MLLPANVKVAFEHYIETDNVTASAEKAGVARKTVYEWFKKYGDELSEMVRDSMAHACSRRRTGRAGASRWPPWSPQERSSYRRRLQALRQ